MTNADIYAVIQTVTAELNGDLEKATEVRSKVSPETYAQVMAAIKKWESVRLAEGYDTEPLSQGPGRIFNMEADHSVRGGLLGYLLEGHEPHPKPPPRAYSRPWHYLIDQGEAKVSEITCWSDLPVFRDDPISSGVVSICQSSEWRRVQILAPTDWVLAHENHGLWRATLLNPEETGFNRRWHLRRFSGDES